MAGIGFELKKLFRATGLFAKTRAFGYASVISAGPLLLGWIFLILIGVIGQAFGLAYSDRMMLNCLITYALMFSAVLSGIFSTALTRYIADMLYEEREEEILPSLGGALFFLLPIEAVLFGIFLLFADLTPALYVLTLTLCLEQVCAVLMMAYLSVLKDYKGVFGGYAAGIGAGLALALLTGLMQGISVSRLLFCVVFGYGLMICAHMYLLCTSLPKEGTHSFLFLSWIGQYKSLVAVGCGNSVALYAPLLIAWYSKLGEHISGILYCAPDHDVAAIFAFMTSLVTTVNFVVLVEVNFYPEYRNYFDMLNGKGTIGEIRNAHKKMLDVLYRELAYMGQRQLYFTVFALSVGENLLELLPLGMTDLSAGYFRILCVGYAVYAIGNVFLMMLLYFSDYRDAAWVSVLFAVCSVVFSLVSLRFPVWFYGFGFSIAAGVLFVTALLMLVLYTKDLDYHVLSAQPLYEEGGRPALLRLSAKLDENLAAIEEKIRVRELSRTQKGGR